MIVSSPDGAMEPELRRTLPPGVEFFTARVKLPPGPHPYDDAKVEPFLGRLAEAGRSLADAGVDLIVFGCTGATFSRGVTWNAQIIKTLHEATGRPVITASSAVIEALHAVKARRILTVTPYPETTNICLMGFLAANGLETLAIHPLDREEIYQAPEMLYGVTRKIAAEKADAVFISCTGVRTIEVLDWLERDLGKPVISSNIACLWHALRRGGINDVISGLGVLLREH